MLPTKGFRDQITPVFKLPKTVAVNACTPDGPSVTVPGVRVTLTGGTRKMLALASFNGSAALVAVTVTVC